MCIPNVHCATAYLLHTLVRSLLSVMCVHSTCDPKQTSINRFESRSLLHNCLIIIWMMHSFLFFKISIFHSTLHLLLVQSSFIAPGSDDTYLHHLVPYLSDVLWYFWISRVGTSCVPLRGQNLGSPDTVIALLTRFHVSCVIPKLWHLKINNRNHWSVGLNLVRLCSTSSSFTLFWCLILFRIWAYF